MEINADPKMAEINALLQNLQANSAFAKDYITVGDFTYGNPNVLSWGENARLIIGKFCSIADNTTIFLGGEHRTDWVSTYPFNALLNEFSFIKGHPKTKGDVVIGNDVWLGRNSTILSGIHIGDGAVVGANANVVKDVPPYAIVGGNPAKIIKYRFSAGIIKKLLKIEWWNWDYSYLPEIIPILQSNNLKALFQLYEKKCKG